MRMHMDSRRHVARATSKTLKMLAIGSASWWALAITLPAAAQTSTPAQLQPNASDTGAGNSLDEIIVTARRRAESLEKVPLTETALSADALEEANVRDERDLGALVPGLSVVYASNGDSLGFAIRGQTEDAFSGSPAGVNIYMDGVALASNVEGAHGLYDMASVEVLKGPQGTLFGRNATGGSLLFNTALPTNTYSGNITLKAGDYAFKEAEAAVSIPIIPDKLEVRVAGIFSDNQGYETNIADGRHPGTETYQSERFTAVVTPTESLKSTFTFQYSNSYGLESQEEIYSVYKPGQTNGGYALDSFAYGLTNGAILNYLDTTQKQLGIYKLDTLGGSLPSANHGLFASNTTTYDLTPNIQIKNILGMFNSVSDEGATNTGAPYNVLYIYNPAHCCDGFHYNNDNWSEEFQVLGNLFINQLNYILGGYVANGFENSSFPADFAGYQLNYDYSNNDFTRALFTQETYNLSQLTHISGLSVTAGIRYTWETLSEDQGKDGLYPAGPDQHTNEGHNSYTFGFEYQVTPEEMLYATTRGSWRAGGYSDQNPVGDSNYFRPEQTHDYEVGSKFQGKLFGRSARLNVAVFDQITTSVQKNIYLTVGGAPDSATLNVPREDTRGVEVDAEYHPTDWLRVGGNAAWTNAKFVENQISLLGVPTVVTNVADTPKWTTTGFVKVRLPTPEQLGPMSIRADASFQSTDYFSSFAFAQVPGTKISDYALVNVRYDWLDILGTNASLGAYVRNAMNRQYFLGGLAVGPTVGLNQALPGAPRTFGVELNYTF